MKVIGLTGVARAGKDTVADIIIEELGLHQDGTPAAIREGFADRLKVSAARALGLTGSDETLIETMDALKVCGSIAVDIEHGQYDVQRFGVSGREYLQRFGTEGHREVFGDTFWVDALLPYSVAQSIETGTGVVRDDCDVLVIPDVRFENETTRILAYGGEVWRVDRPGVDAVNGHASEAGIPDALVRRTIRNIAGLGYLRGQVRSALMAAGFLLAEPGGYDCRTITGSSSTPQGASSPKDES